LKNGKIEHRYLWGAMQDELLAMDDDWTLRDHLNTVRKVVNAKGKVVSDLEYNAFGALINATGVRPLFRYTGKLFDDATALQWNINRWYDAGVGRWISEDPIGFEGKGTNLCRYVENFPLVFTDVTGLQTDEELCEAFRKSNKGKKAGVQNAGGFVLCYLWGTPWGRKISCVNSDMLNDNVPNIIARILLERCMREHEDSHIPDAKCLPCVPGVGFARSEAHRVETECKGYSVELQCLLDSKWLCSLSINQKECADTVQDRADQVLAEKNKYC
jgi:RHS repeat-associated protein